MTSENNPMSARQRAKAAARCLAGAQHALLVTNEYAEASLWCAMAMVHIGPLPSREAVDEIFRKIDTVREG